MSPPREDRWSNDLEGAAAHAEHYREPSDLDFDDDAPEADDGEDDDEFHANLIPLTGWL